MKMNSLVETYNASMIDGRLDSIKFGVKKIEKINAMEDNETKSEEIQFWIDELKKLL